MRMTKNSNKVKNGIDRDRSISDGGQDLGVPRNRNEKNENQDNKDERKLFEKLRLIQ